MMRLFGWSVKKTLPAGVARRTFGELKISGQLFEFRAGRNDAFTRRERRRGQDQPDQGAGQKQELFHHDADSLQR